MSSVKVIPGLNKAIQPTPAASSKTRKRGNKKNKQEKEEVATNTAKEADLVSSDLAALLEDVTSPAEGLKKRLRAAYKKKQRIDSYTSRDITTLNEDQVKALEGRPIVEAVIKELEGALQSFNDGILTLVQTAVNKAVERERQNTNFSNVTQFIALNDIYANSEESFAPPDLPEALAKATGQEVASIRLTHNAIFNQFDDSKLALLVMESTEEILPGVSYKRLIELSKAVPSNKDTDIASEEAPVEQNVLASPSDKADIPTPSSTPPTSVDAENQKESDDSKHAPPAEKVKLDSDSTVKDSPADTKKQGDAKADGQNKQNKRKKRSKTKENDNPNAGQRTKDDNKDGKDSQESKNSRNRNRFKHKNKTPKEGAQAKKDVVSSAPVTV